LPNDSPTIGLTRGLAKIANANGILVAYAMQSGDVAADGDARNSPFTSAFLANLIDTPNVEIVQFFRKVATDVSKATNGDQVPEFSISGNVPEFYLWQESAGDLRGAGVVKDRDQNAVVTLEERLYRNRHIIVCRPIILAGNVETRKGIACVDIPPVFYAPGYGDIRGASHLPTPHVLLKASYQRSRAAGICQN
jgi:hypothetical protein